LWLRPVSSRDTIWRCACHNRISTERIARPRCAYTCWIRCSYLKDRSNRYSLWLYAGTQEYAFLYSKLCLLFSCLEEIYREMSWMIAF